MFASFVYFSVVVGDGITNPVSSSGCDEANGKATWKKTYEKYSESSLLYTVSQIAYRGGRDSFALFKLHWKSLKLNRESFSRNSMCNWIPVSLLRRLLLKNYDRTLIEEEGATKIMPVSLNSSIKSFIKGADSRISSCTPSEKPKPGRSSAITRKPSAPNRCSVPSHNWKLFWKFWKFRKLFWKFRKFRKYFESQNEIFTQRPEQQPVPPDDSVCLSWSNTIVNPFAEVTFDLGSASRKKTRCSRMVVTFSRMTTFSLSPIMSVTRFVTFWLSRTEGSKMFGNEGMIDMFVRISVSKKYKINSNRTYVLFIIFWNFCKVKTHHLYC